MAHGNSVCHPAR